MSQSRKINIDNWPTIGKALAESEPFVYRAIDAEYECIFCDATDFNQSEICNADIHDADCLWRRAVELANTEAPAETNEPLINIAMANLTEEERDEFLKGIA